MGKLVKKIKHIKPVPDTPPALFTVGAKVLHDRYRVVVQKVWWSGESWMYEVEGAANGPYRGLWIFREDSLKKEEGTV